ncbi:copper chaperone PCu(A)C [Leucothrix sargassi]|nr:copper chaperone PCu(A)C [Leucothrix sargassi]
MNKLVIGTLLALSFISTLNAEEYTVGDLKVDHPYTRSTPPMAPVGGGFMTITNSGDKDDTLISGTAAFSESVEIHEMIMNGKGVMRMQQLSDGLTIPAGESVELKPGGYHIMFIGLSEQMIPDESHKGTLTFKHAGEVEVTFTVKDITAMTESTIDHSKMDHSQMNHGETTKKDDVKEEKAHAHHH